MSNESVVPSASDSTWGAFLLGCRGAIAGVCAVAVALVLKLPYPLYALIAAVLVSDASMATVKALGGQRLIGTLIGAMTGAILSMLCGNALYGMGLAILIALLCCHKAGLREAAKFAGYVAGLIVLEHTHSPWRYALDRLIETSIGIIFAYLVGILFQLVLSRTHAGAGKAQ